MQQRDRAILVGASNTGKSTLASYLLAGFRTENPDARILVVDTKPRWRGTVLPNGSRPRRLYRDMVEGDTIPGAMVMQDMTDWPLCWDRDVNPSRTVIAQRIVMDWRDDSAEETAVLNFATDCIARFFATQKAKEPSLVYIDEGHDFYHNNGAPKGRSGSAIQRCYRAGREKGLASLTGFQRPTGLNIQLLTELNYCGLFRINAEDDAKRLREMGWPKNTPPPSYAQGHSFKLWRDGRPEAPRYELVPRAHGKYALAFHRDRKAAA